MPLAAPSSSSSWLEPEERRTASEAFGGAALRFLPRPCAPLAAGAPSALVFGVMVFLLLLFLSESSFGAGVARENLREDRRVDEDMMAEEDAFAMEDDLTLAFLPLFLSFCFENRGGKAGKERKQLKK